MMSKAAEIQKPVDSIELQLQKQRRTVDFDTFDIFTQQLVSMLKNGQIWASPAYQRKFRWAEERCSQFIESLLLGIPVPSLFMATNADNTWEVVDGLQRLTALIWFAGDKDLRDKHHRVSPLVLTGLQKLSKLDGLTLLQCPPSIQQHFWTRPIKVITLSDKSDAVVRYDLFERLNTGGIALSDQEIRDCVFRGEFANKLEQWSADHNFKAVLKLTKSQQRDATGEECVLRFFAFLNRYKEFDHSVVAFLNDYMESAKTSFDFDSGDSVFKKTFSELARAFPKGIRRPGGKMTTPLNLFEGISVGAALAIKKKGKISIGGLSTWMNSAKLRKFTTGATNDRNAVRGRIEYCRDRFLGMSDVSDASN